MSYVSQSICKSRPLHTNHQLDKIMDIKIDKYKKKNYTKSNITLSEPHNREYVNGLYDSDDSDLLSKPVC